MSKFYRLTDRLGLVLAILAAFAMPVFVLCVPVSAVEAVTYLYNGIELPDITLVHPDPSTYKYVFLFDVSKVFPTSNYVYGVAFVKNVSYYVSGLGRSISVNSGNMLTYLNNGIWETARDGGGLTGYPIDGILWANFDVTDSEGNIILPSSDPVSPGVPLEFEVTASWEPDTTYEYDEGEISDVFSVSTTLGIEYTHSYQWFGKSFLDTEWTDLTGAIFPTFVPDTSLNSIGAFVYFCRVTVTDGTQTVINDSPFLYIRVYEIPEATASSGDGAGEDLDDIQDSLDDLQDSLDGIMNGTEDQKEQAESFGKKTEEQLGQIKEDMSAIEQITVPDFEDIDLNIDTQISGDGMSAMAMLLGIMMNSQTISTSMTFAFLFSLVAFVIFGKR